MFMNKVLIDFTNCFGIDKLEYEFDFSVKNVYSIYAKNGSMKTSFANTFQKIQQGKANEICDKIYEIPGNAIVKIDDNDIEKENIFVIKSYEVEYESDISPLLVRGELKESLKDVLKSRDKLFKVLEKDSGLKIKKTLQGKTVYELEPRILEDFSFSEQSFLLNLENLKPKKFETDFSDIMYSIIFDGSIQKKIQSYEFQNGIDAFIKKITDKEVVCHGQKDFLFLTYLLHEKAKTDSIKFSDLKSIYKEYLGKENFERDVNSSDRITDCLYNICDTLTENNNLLEDKVLLSMAIRHKAEKIMLREIKSSSSIFKWEDNKIIKSGNNTLFLKFVDNSDNQTKNLIVGYKQIASEDNAKLMSEVSIMTSENIHLNSFMYEPLLDMDIQELLNLYQRIKKLLGE